MNDINEVLAKLSKHRMGCPNFVLSELERLYGEVDSLQQQVKELQEGNRAACESREAAVRSMRETCITSNQHYAKVVELMEQLAERDRTIDLLNEKIANEVAISAKALANLKDIRALVAAGWYKSAKKRLDEALGE